MNQRILSKRNKNINATGTNFIHKQCQDNTSNHHFAKSLHHHSLFHITCMLKIRYRILSVFTLGGAGFLLIWASVVPFVSNGGRFTATRLMAPPVAAIRDNFILKNIYYLLSSQIMRVLSFLIFLFPLLSYQWYPIHFCLVKCNLKFNHDINQVKK